MDSEDRAYVWMTVAIVTGLTAVIGGITVANTIAGVEENTVKIACLDNGRVWYEGDCIPEEALAPFAVTDDNGR